MRKILNILLIIFVLAWGSSVLAHPPNRTLDTENMPSTTYQDDTALIFGTDGDFHFEYNSTTGLWQWSDGTNIFFTLKDDGTTGIFDFYDEIDLHKTAGSGAGVAYHGLGIEMQVGALNAASLMHGINFTVVGDTNGEVSAIGTNGPISPIHQHVGTLGNMDWGSIYTASAHTDKTTAFNTSGAPSATLTDAVNDYFLIADAGTFEQISIELLTLASLDQWLTFEYGDGSQAWVTFIPFDGTDGLTKDGLITWSAADLTTWGTDTVNEITGKSGSSNLYWIKITRTRPGNPTDPIENHIQILSPVTYEWDEDGTLDIYSVTIDNTETANSYTSQIEVEWTAGADMASGGSNGIYSISNAVEDVSNAYALRGRMDLRDQTSEGVAVGQLHAIDALVNLSNQTYTVTDNLSVIGAAMHSVGITADVEAAEAQGGSVNLFYGVWGDSMTEDLTAGGANETNGLLIVSHAGTYLDHGVKIETSSTMDAGILIEGHASNSPATIGAGVKIVSAAGKVTYGLDMDGAGIITAEIRGSNGEIIENVNDGTWGFGTAEITAGSISISKYEWMEDMDDEVAGVEWESGLRADFWTTAGTNYASGNVTYTAGPGGTLQIKNAAAEDDSVTIIGAPNFREALNPVFEARIKIDDITTVHWAVGLVEGAYSSNGTYDDDIVLIGQDTDEAAGNIYLITNDAAGGVEFTDSGIDAVNGVYLKVKFDATDPEDIRLWINDVEIDISGANIQAATTLMPYIMVQNLAGGAIQRILTVDYIKIWQDRG